MRNGVAYSLSALIVAWTMAVPGFAQQPAPSPATKAAPAPRRDLSGAWAGPVIPRKLPVPPMTAWGQAFFDGVKPLSGPRAVPIAQTTDPFSLCDPMGFPRSVLYETRGFAFEHLPKKTLHLLQYQRAWREIWTDGRKLPTNVGTDADDSLDPRYYGYSVGAWADDYTFVINTTGFNEAAWADEFGHPRSLKAMVEERYHRIDHDTLELTVNIDDPKGYTKPFTAMKQIYTWNPKQEFEEQLCVTSEVLEYNKIFAPPGTEK